MAFVGILTFKVNAEKPFYDSKSWIVNVAGNPDFLIENGFQSKVYPLKTRIPQTLPAIPSKNYCESLAREYTSKGYGKMMIDAITKNGESEDLLKRLALANVKRQDVEFGISTSKVDDGADLNTVLSEDYLPILMNNYICQTYTHSVRDKNGNVKTKVYYAIFKVWVSKEQAFDIESAINDPLRYKQLSFPVTFMTMGEYGEKMESDIAKKVPALAVRGVLLQRNPAKISIGENSGLHKGDLVSIYSQRSDKHGNPFSKRISRARVCGVWDDTAQINFEANTAGNRKNGDVVVRAPDSHFRFGVKGSYLAHNWGGGVLMDVKTGFNRSGIIHHILADLEVSVTDDPGKKFLVYNEDYRIEKEYYAPIFFNIGLGYGFSKTFLGFLDVMPFFLVQGEFGLMMNFDKEDESYSPSPYQDEKSKTLMSLALRFPIGLRLSCNLGYPVRFFVEGGYALNCFLGNDGDNLIVKEAIKSMGVKREGIFASVGFMF